MPKSENWLREAKNYENNEAAFLTILFFIFFTLTRELYAADDIFPQLFLRNIIQYYIITSWIRKVILQMNVINCSDFHKPESISLNGLKACECYELTRRGSLDDVDSKGWGRTHEVFRNGTGI